jgi:hypothetical protein
MWARSGKCDPRGMRNSYVMMIDGFKEYKTCLNFALSVLLETCCVRQMLGP